MNLPCGHEAAVCEVSNKPIVHQAMYLGCLADKPILPATVYCPQCGWVVVSDAFVERILAPC